MDKRGDNKTVVIGAIGLAILVVIIVVIYVILNAFGSAPKMFHQDENTKKFTSKQLVRIEKAVRDTLVNGYGYSEDAAAKMKLTMREVDRKTYNDHTISLYFLVDVDDLGLTYEASISSDDTDDGDVYLTCAPVEKTKDKNVFCVSYGGFSTIDLALKEHMPYMGLINDETVVTVDMSTDGQHAAIETDVSLCYVSSSPSDDTVRDFVKDWIRSVTDINPDIFPINVNYYNCEGQPLE